MKNLMKIFQTIFYCLMVTGFVNAHTAFKHTATNGNTNRNYTLINHAATNNDASKLLFVTHDYGRGHYIKSPLGVWYTNGKWSIFQQDLSPMPKGAMFNVLVKSKNDPNVLVHTANKDNTFAHITSIDHPALNNKPNAKVLLTQNWGTKGTYNNAPIGIYYYQGKWRIINQNRQPIPENARFNIFVTPSGSFQHTAGTAKLGKHVTSLGNKSRDKNQLLFVTQLRNVKENPHTVGVWHNGRNWTIYHEDRQEMPTTAKFTVFVVGEKTSKGHPEFCTEIGTKKRKPKIRNHDGSIGNVSAPLVALTANLWPVGKTIKVSMDNAASPALQNKIMNLANEWTRYANVNFKHVRFGGDIHIKFDPNGGHYSLIGNQSDDFLTRLGYDIISRGTMNLMVDDNTSDSELSRVVLHEFGHALGFMHEHQNPSVEIPWNKEAVYKYYRENFGWDRGKVYNNIFKKLEAGQTQYSSFDRNSIMLYTIPNELTRGDYSVSSNRILSEMDKRFASVLYPFPNSTGNRIRATIKTGRDDLREKCNANLIIKYWKNSKIEEFQVSLNRGKRWGGNETNSKEVSLPSGVGINDIIEITLFFASEKRIFTDEDDTWLVDKIKYEYVDRYNNVFPLLEELQGTPYIAFIGKRNPYFSIFFE